MSASPVKRSMNSGSAIGLKGAELVSLAESMIGSQIYDWLKANRGKILTWREPGVGRVIAPYKWDAVCDRSQWVLN